MKHILEDVGTLTKINVKVTVKAKALSCWIFENVPNENCSLLTEKKTKSRRQIKPQKFLLEKNEERENKKSEEKERRRRKKAMAALLVFMLTSLEMVFERKRLFEGRGLFWL